MVWYSAAVTAYDAMGQVHISARVHGDDGVGEAQMREVFSCATTVPGVGEDAPARWLRDALVALAETL